MTRLYEVRSRTPRRSRIAFRQLNYVFAESPCEAQDWVRSQNPGRELIFTKTGLARLPLPAVLFEDNPTYPDLLRFANTI